MSSQAAGSTPRNLVSPKDAGNSPSNGAENAPRDDDEGWSGEEDDEENGGGGDGGGGDGSRKRKRPMSVSCELCKQRKARNTDSSTVHLLGPYQC